jgi:hypothetical protein
MFRLPALKAIPTVLLSNPRLVDLLASLPFETNRTERQEQEFDIIAWEVFRQLVSPHVDPISAGTVQIVSNLIQRREREIESLRLRCFNLAKEFKGETSLPALERSIAQHIRGQVEADIQAILEVDKAAAKEFLDSVFSDEKAWGGIAAFIYSFFQGGPAITAAGAICAISVMGSKAVQSLAKRREKLETNDYALLYRMKQ